MMKKTSRLQPDKLVEDLPLASDVLVASLWRRLLAFLIDLVIIIASTFFITMPLLTILLGDEDHRLLFISTMRLLVLAFSVTWGVYVVWLNTSSMQATFGQKLVRIYVCDVFGETITTAVAAGRFFVFAAPLLIFLAGGMEEIMSVLPTIPMMNIVHTHDVEVNEYFYIIFLVASMIQFLLIWPMITGNYSRVLWDDLFHTRVLLKTMRKH